MSHKRLRLRIFQTLMGPNGIEDVRQLQQCAVSGKCKRLKQNPQAQTQTQAQTLGPKA